MLPALEPNHVSVWRQLYEETVRSRALGVFVVDLAADPFLDPIRDEPRYRELLTEVGLAEHWPVEDQT